MYLIIVHKIELQYLNDFYIKSHLKVFLNGFLKIASLKHGISNSYSKDHQTVFLKWYHTGLVLFFAFFMGCELLKNGKSLLISAEIFHASSSLFIGFSLKPLEFMRKQPRWAASFTLHMTPAIKMGT